MPVWVMRSKTTADGKVVAHAEYLIHMWLIAKSREGETHLYNVKAHQKSNSEVFQLNSKVHRLAKKAAILSPEILLTKSNPKLTPVCPSALNSQEQIDLVKLQTKDSEIQDLLKKEEVKGLKVYKDKNNLILAIKKDMRDSVPVLVILLCLRKELVSLFHSQGHFGKEKILNKLSSIGWWPSMVQDIDICIRNCLNCTENNPD